MTTAPDTRAAEEAVAEPVLSLRNVSMNYPTKAGLVQAVSDVSLDIFEGESIGIVGESGCGKSTLARAILQLPPPTAGSIFYRSVDLTSAKGETLRKLRPELQLVFQDPISSLNPRRTVGSIVAETLDIWKIGTPENRRTRAEDMLRSVGLDPEVYADRRPGELSGGQCQRVAIARSLVAGARVLVCDEAISSLDVSLRAQVINLIEGLRKEFNFTLLFIAHDLGVVKNISDRIAVMYLGRIVELADANDLQARPLHPYTEALFRAVPEVGKVRDRRGPAVRGEPPSPLNPPSGCRFRTRCPRAQEICTTGVPPLQPIDGMNHFVACHFPLNEPALAAPA